MFTPFIPLLRFYFSAAGMPSVALAKLGIGVWSNPKARMTLKVFIILALVVNTNTNILKNTDLSKMALGNISFAKPQTVDPEKPIRVEEEKLPLKLPVGTKEELALSWEQSVSALRQAQRAELEAAKAKLQEESLARQQILAAAGFNPEWASLYKTAQDTYGTPWQIIAAIHKVETGQSGDTTKGSGAGAKGPMQFITGTFNHWAQDGDGDGKTNIFDVDDAVFTAARHLAAGGAGTGNDYKAIFNYNHSGSYVAKVLGLAKTLGYNG